MWYLCVFFHRLLDYRRPEVEALAELFQPNKSNEPLKWRVPEDHHPDSPFHFVNLSSDDVARDIANRSLLVKGMYELWGEGSTLEELEQAIKSYPDERKSPYLSSESTFRITVDSFGKVMSFEEQNDRIHQLAYIPFEGRVNLKHPDHKFWLMETDDHGGNNGLPPGADIDIRVVRDGRGPDRNVWSNFKQVIMDFPSLRYFLCNMLQKEEASKSRFLCRELQ
ncbi:unnamed protein product [Linum tenue]|uniref:tRNA (guanine(10)-N(2))-methyltransferase TRMT11 N-terminal domain-containing protein n=1 Tax=Linum tenue TaxID=586396 RepID=A0AAV0GRV0_9ROSI|nr:unnamed protein product [Linum tenue]